MIRAGGAAVGHMSAVSEVIGHRLISVRSCSGWIRGLRLSEVDIVGVRGS
jgi:hypothetical protein